MAVLIIHASRLGSGTRITIGDATITIDVHTGQPPARHPADVEPGSPGDLIAPGMRTVYVGIGVQVISSWSS